MDISKLVIRKINRGYGIYRANGTLNWMLSQVTDFHIKTEGEKETKNDADGVPVVDFWKAKKVTITGNTPFFDLDFTAAQWGTKKEVATVSSKILTPYSEDFQTTESQTTYVLEHTPSGVKGAEIKSLMTLSKDGSIATTYKLGTGSATPTTFLLDAATKKITLPTGIEAGTHFFVFYEYYSSNTVKVTNYAESVPQAEKVVFEVTGYNICDTQTAIVFYVVMENGTLSVNSDISTNTTDENPFEINGSQDYCIPGKDLVSIIVPGDTE